MKYYIKTFGCQMNYADSERIKTIFESRGLTEADDINEAEYLVFNSCAVRKKAEDKLMGYGKQVSEHKNLENSMQYAGDANYPVTIMTGCMVKTGVRGRVKRKSSESIRKKFEQDVDWLDHAVPTKRVFALIEMLLDRDQNVHELKKNLGIDTEYLNISPTPYSKFQASLPISVGCNHHCTFCTVPFSRGAEEFREYKSIKQEYLDYVESDYRQITLLGQTVNKWLNPKYKYHPKAHGWYRYGEILPNALDGDGVEPDNFLTLIKELDSVKGDYWLNFVSSYPNYFTDDVIDYIVESINSDEGHLNSSIHLALQSGSNRMLKEMYRHYTVEEFKMVVEKFRKGVPDISITTDIIVGFVGETKEDYELSKKLVEDMEFDMVYISEYSVRPDTPAEELGDDVSREEKKRRKEELNDILRSKLEKKNQKFIGKKQSVLISDRKHNNLMGKNRFGKDVEVEHNSDIKDIADVIGKFIEVEIKEATAWGLKGSMVASN